MLVIYQMNEFAKKNGKLIHLIIINSSTWIVHHGCIKNISVLFYTHKWTPDSFRSSPMSVILNINFDIHNISIEPSGSLISINLIDVQNYWNLGLNGWLFDAHAGVVSRFNTKIFWKIRFESEWNTTFRVVSEETFQKQGNI